MRTQRAAKALHAHALCDSPSAPAGPVTIAVCHVSHLTFLWLQYTTAYLECQFKECIYVLNVILSGFAKQKFPTGNSRKIPQCKAEAFLHNREGYFDYFTM